MLRLSVILALLAGFALSPKLWLSSRTYPLTPVWQFLRPLSSPADHIVFYALAAALIVLSFAPRRATFTAAFALLALVALQDQSRWQPWFYQYVVMLLAIALAGAGRQAAARNTCCLIVAATYIWSGLAKLNPNFMSDAFPSLVDPLIKTWPTAAQWPVGHLGYLAPFLECGLGAGLITRRFRPAALFFAIAMHAFILITIGPLGRRYNSVVWPWNLAMMAFLLILFRRTEDPAPQDILWGREFAYQKVVLVLFAIMPALSFFNLWDDYLSSALYSGNKTSAVIYVSDAALDRLPEQIADYVTEGAPDRNELDINDWSFGEMNVPSYPAPRIYKNVARQVCRYAPDGAGVELVVEGKFALANGNRRSVYHCADLLPLVPPSAFPGRAESVLRAFRDALGLEARGGTGFEHDQSRLVPRMADDTGFRQRDGIARQGHIAELLVFVIQLRVFEAAMQTAPLHACGEVAPLGTD